MVIRDCFFVFLGEESCKWNEYVFVLRHARAHVYKTLGRIVLSFLRLQGQNLARQSVNATTCTNIFFLIMKTLLRLLYFAGRSPWARRHVRTFSTRYRLLYLCPLLWTAYVLFVCPPPQKKKGVTWRRCGRTRPQNRRRRRNIRSASSRTENCRGRRLR